MLATFIIVFREVIEAGLIIGIVMAATRGVAGRTRWVSGGVVAGVLGACIIAMFTSSISQAMEGMGQELFNAFVLSLAVIMLTWHNVWMAKHGRELAAQVREVGQKVASGQRSLIALTIVVGVAVLREGAEIVLFLYGIAVSAQESVGAMGIGGMLGLAAGGALGTLTYLGLLRIPNKYLFAVTGWMLALLAAGMAAQAAALLQQADVVSAMGSIVWDSSHILSSGSTLGMTLGTLIGYQEQPSQLQLLVYVATLVVTFTLMKLFSPSSRPTKPAMAMS